MPTICGLAQLFCIGGTGAFNADILASIRPSKPLLPALVESNLPVWESRRFSRQLYDGFALLAAISKNLQEKAFIALLHYFDFDQLLRHLDRTKIGGRRFLPCS